MYDLSFVNMCIILMLCIKKFSICTEFHSCNSFVGECSPVGEKICFANLQKCQKQNTLLENGMEYVYNTPLKC